MFKKTFIIFILIIFSALILSDFVLAQEKELEITYPTVPGAQTPTSLRAPLPEYVNYIFNFSIWIAGFVAFGTLIYGGVRYLTSAGSPTATADAREQIFAGILGLIIILSAYTILVNINPQLVVLKEPGMSVPAAGEIPGVYLCKTAQLSTSTCIVYTMTSDTIDPNFDDNFTNVFFKNIDTAVYGVVLHEDKGRRGSCEVHTSNSSIGIKASSITVFKQGGTAGEGITLYEAKEYNKECGTECYQTCRKGEVCGDDCVGLIIKSGGKCWGPYTSTPTTMEMSDDDTRSIEINPLGKYLAVLSSEPNLGKCQVFTTNYDYLKGTYIGITHIKSLIILPIK